MRGATGGREEGRVRGREGSLSLQYIRVVSFSSSAANGPVTAETSLLLQLLSKLPPLPPSHQMSLLKCLNLMTHFLYSRRCNSQQQQQQQQHKQC